MGAADDICQSVADEVACAGVGQRSTQSQRTNEEHQHIPRNITQSRLGIDYAEQDHQQAADQSDRPSCKFELCGEDEAEDSCEEDDDAQFVDHRAELFCLLAALFLFQCFDGDDRLFRGELRSKEQCPERNNDQNRPCANGEVDGTEGHIRESVGLHETGELTRHLDGRGQGQDAAARHADDHDGEHILGAAVSGLIAESGQ